MFLYVSYSANIVVLLQSTSEIHNMKELLESHIEAGGYDTSYMKVYLSVSILLKDILGFILFSLNFY